VQYYIGAAQRYGLGPDGYAYLAAINYVETSFGTDLSTSSAGAIGWMQFEPDTWRAYGVAVSNPGGQPDPNDPQDAIYSAARYLHTNGAPGDWPAAIFAYNHAGWYVAHVQQLASEYSGQAGVQKLIGDINAAWGGKKPTLPPAAQPVSLTQPLAATQPASCACPTANASTTRASPAGGIDEHGASGFTPDPGTNFTVNLEPSIAQRLDLLGKRLHVAIYGISGYRTPAHSLEVGGFADDPHTRGAAADIGVGGPSRVSAAQLTDAQLASVGLTRPFDESDDPSNPEVNHVQIINPDRTLLDINAQPPIATPAQAPATPNPTPPLIPGTSASTPLPVTRTLGAQGAGACSPGSGNVATVPGTRAVILADGTALAPADAPWVVQAMIAAGNRIDHFPYSYGGGHGAPAQTMNQSAPDPAAFPGMQENGGPGYDCSGATSYVLYGGGFGQRLLAGGVDDSTMLESVGDPGAGRWVTWFANADHVYIEIAGIYFNTSGASFGKPPDPPSTGPRWATTAGESPDFVQRHPAAL
jgi:Transglycosylase SLT domain/Peptidase M15